MRACGRAVLVAAALLGIWIWSSPSDSPQLHVRHAATEFLARRAVVSVSVVFYSIVYSKNGHEPSSQFGPRSVPDVYECSHRVVWIL